MGGALGVAIIGSLVASVYAAGIDDIAAHFGLAGPVLAEARGSLGGALKSAGSMGASGPDFATAAKDSFVHGLSNGLRLGAVVVLVAAFVAYKFLPATAHDFVDSPEPVRGVGVAPVAGA
jgi:DHA2 family multidrug resistance protein-like MFS transporter